jgi:hypothetical protein
MMNDSQLQKAWEAGQEYQKITIKSLWKTFDLQHVD